MTPGNNSSSSYSLVTILLLQALLISFLSGCAGQPTGTLDRTDKKINSSMSSADRDKLIKTMRKEGENVKVDSEFRSNLDRLSSQDVRELCNQYCENENFSKCRSCLDTYLKRDDIQVVLNRSCSNPGKLSPETVGADFLHVIDFYEKRARMGIFFSDFVHAQSNIDIYADLVGELEKCGLPKQSDHYTRAAEIYALIGDRTGQGASNKLKIDRYLAIAQELARQSEDRDSKIISEVNKSAILVHMATQNYQKALEILVDPRDYLNKTYGERTGESLQDRAGIITGLAVIAGGVSALAGMNNQDAALVAGGVAVGGILATMIEEGVADIENLPYRNFQIAKCKYELGFYDEAKEKYTQLLEGKKKDERVNLEVVYTDLGKMYYNEKNYSEAAKYLKKAVSLIERYRAALNSDADKIGFIKEDRQIIYLDLVDSLMETGAVEEALEYAERAKSRALVDLLATKQEFGSGPNRDDYTIFIQQQQKAEEQMARSERSTGGNTRSSAASRNDNDTIKRSNQELASLVTVNSLKFAAIKSFLAQDETMLEYYGEDSQLYVFVVTPQSVHMEKIENAELPKLVHEYSKNISLDRPVFRLQHARGFYDILIKPVSRYLAKTKKLTIIPHGPLHRLPFNAFLDDANMYLIEKYSIRMLPSASVMEFLKESTSRNAHMLILSNPYIENYEPGQAPIFGTVREAVALAELFETARHLTGKDATETVLKRYGDVPSILHIASHAEFNEDDPLLSRLLLAGDGAEDGSLTVNDLYNMELNNYLVTLSACETGLGKNKNGDNIIGLVRGFFFAGAESIVNTLWKIDDEFSTSIMVDFYRNLAVYDKQEALRQAQLNFLRNVRSDPYFWASFQIMGASGLPPERVAVSDDAGLSLGSVERKKLEEFKQLKRDMTIPQFDRVYPAAETYARNDESQVRSVTRSLKTRRRKTMENETKPLSDTRQEGSTSYTSTFSSPPDTGTSSMMMASRKESAAQQRLEIDYDVKIVLDNDENRGATFLETVEKIPLTVYLGYDSPYKYISLVVSDKGRGTLVNEIPILVDAKFDYVESSLKRPLQGWTKGFYEIVVKDQNGIIISRKEFSIVE